MFYFRVIKTIFLSSVLFFCAVVFTNAQSSDQNFPTPVTSSQLGGAINARAIGDSRLTTYYFTFNGNQGDIFINVVTGNFNGDIDIFAAEGLRPLTKIVIYADSSDNETGRVIYLRKPEKILMRVQGRSPNDDPATFQIKFAGSFIASSEAETDAPKLPEVTKENKSGVIVNSVGTIIGIKPKPTPEPKDIVVKKIDEPETTVDETAETVEEKNEEKTVAETVDEKTEPQKTETPQVIITDELEKKDTTKTDETVAKTDDEVEEIAETSDEKKEIKTEKNKDETVTAEKEKPKKVKEKTKKEKELEALENIQLVVLLKDGGKIERPMSEILKFGVEKGTLTIIHKNGSISRYSILDVESITIR